MIAVTQCVHGFILKRENVRPTRISRSPTGATNSVIITCLYWHRVLSPSLSLYLERFKRHAKAEGIFGVTHRTGGDQVSAARQKQLWAAAAAAARAATTTTATNKSLAIFTLNKNKKENEQSK